MRARVLVQLKPSLYDPQGEAICNVLHSIGFSGVTSCRQGKQFVLELDASLTRENARGQVDEMCRKLLANAVIEDYAFEIQE